MTAVVTIRPVCARDLVRVRAMLVDTWHATYDGIYGVAKVDDITARWHSLDALALQCDRPDSAFLVATEDDDIVASSYAHRTAPDVVHLYRLYVRPSHQGRRIGAQLMSETFAPFTGVNRQRLEVEPANHRALAFYERAGFKLVGRTGDCGGASGVAALIFERSVG